MQNLYKAINPISFSINLTLLKVNNFNNKAKLTTLDNFVTITLSLHVKFQRSRLEHSFHYRQARITWSYTIQQSCCSQNNYEQSKQFNLNGGIKACTVCLLSNICKLVLCYDESHLHFNESREL